MITVVRDLVKAGQGGPNQVNEALPAPVGLTSEVGPLR